MTPVQQFEGQDYDTVSVTIPSGQSLSPSPGVVDAGEIVGVELPTIDSAAISFQVSYDGVTARDLYANNGTTEVSIAATTGNRVVEAPDALRKAGAVQVKVRSGLTGAAVNQTADRVIKLLVRRLNP